MYTLLNEMYPIEINNDLQKLKLNLFQNYIAAQFSFSVMLKLKNRKK